MAQGAVESSWPGTGLESMQSAHRSGFGITTEVRVMSSINGAARLGLRSASTSRERGSLQILLRLGSALLLALMAAPIHAALPFVLEAAPEGQAIARTPSGLIAWRVDRARGGPLSY